MADKGDDDFHISVASGSDSEDNSEENERNDATIPSIPPIEPPANGGNGISYSQMSHSQGGNWVNKSGDFLVPYFELCFY